MTVCDKKLWLMPSNRFIFIFYFRTQTQAEYTRSRMKIWNNFTLELANARSEISRTFQMLSTKILISPVYASNHAIIRLLLFLCIRFDSSQIESPSTYTVCVCECFIFLLLENLPSRVSVWCECCFFFLHFSFSLSHCDWMSVDTVAFIQPKYFVSINWLSLCIMCILLFFSLHFSSCIVLYD